MDSCVCVCVFSWLCMSVFMSFLKWNLSDKATGLIRNNCLSFFASSRGFSYVDLVEGVHDGRFYALKRILCHDREGRKEAQTEVEMHRLFNHPNILSLTSHTFMERGTKCEAWLLLPYISVSGLRFVFPFQASNKSKISVTSERCSMSFKSVSCAELFLCRREVCGQFWRSCGIRGALCLRAVYYTFCMASARVSKIFMTKAMHTGTESTIQLKPKFGKLCFVFLHWRWNLGKITSCLIVINVIGNTLHFTTALVNMN